MEETLHVEISVRTMAGAGPTHTTPSPKPTVDQNANLQPLTLAYANPGSGSCKLTRGSLTTIKCVAILGSPQGIETGIKFSLSRGVAAVAHQE